MFGRGSLTPRTLSIFAIRAPGGTDLPDYQEMTSALGIWIILANYSLFHPLASRAWAIAIFRSWGMLGANINTQYTFMIILIVHNLGDMLTIELETLLSKLIVALNFEPLQQ